MDRNLACEKIRASLERKPGQTAREIADALGVTTTLVNSVLYRELAHLAEKGENFRWVLKDIQSELSHGASTSPAVHGGPTTKKVSGPVAAAMSQSSQAGNARSTLDQMNGQADGQYPDEHIETTPNYQFDAQEEQTLRNLLNEARSRLLDKTRRNRLLNFRESKKDIAIVDEAPNQVYEHLVLNNGKFYFDSFEPDLLEGIAGGPTEEGQETAPPSRTLPASSKATASQERKYYDDRLQTPYTERDLDRRLYKLYLEHRSIIQETGANCLFLAIGYLKWCENDRSEATNLAPLILLPVRLERKRQPGATSYELHFDDEAIDTNYSLYEKLRHDFGISLPELEDEQLPENYWDAVEKSIPESRRDSWSLVREMTLGLFRFHKQIMWHDLNPDRWPKHAPITSKPMIERVLLGPRENQPPPGKVKKEYSTEGENGNEIPLVLDADPSQYSALVDALERNSSLVVEGPPGTGKSQTIANLIAAAMSQGKTILFVAEKMAALEVVFSRLDQAGLGDFCLQLHGLRTSKRELLDSLQKRFEYAPTPRTDLKKKKEQLELARQKLKEFSGAMSTPVGPYSEPLYEAIWKREQRFHELPDGYLPTIEHPASSDSTQFSYCGDLLEDLATELSATPKEVRAAWKGFSPRELRDHDQQLIAENIEKQLAAVSSLRDELQQLGYNEMRDRFASVSWIMEVSQKDNNALIPQLPEGSNPTAFRRLLGETEREEYRTLLQQAHAYLQDIDSVNLVFDYLAENANQVRSFINDYLTDLIDTCLAPDTKLDKIQRELQLHTNATTHLNALEVNAKPITSIFEVSLRTLNDFESVVARAKFISDGPASLSVSACPQHALASASNYLSTGQSQCEDLVGEISSNSLFMRATNVSSDELKAAHSEIAAKSRNPFAFFSRKYREAKTLVRQCMRDPSEFSRDVEFLKSLNDFARVLSRIEEFGVDTQLTRHLGAAFKGVETDWEDVQRLIEYSQTLRKKVGVDNAVRLLNDWDKGLDAVTNAQEELEKSLRELRRFQDSHPYPSSLWSRPVGEIARTLDHWSSRMAAAMGQTEWQQVSGSATIEQAATAATSFGSAGQFQREIHNHIFFGGFVEHHWKGAETDLSDIESYLEWVECRLKHKAITDSVLSWIFTEDGSFRKAEWDSLHRKCRQFSETITNCISNLNEFGSLDEVQWFGSAATPLTETKGKLFACASNAMYLLPLAQFSALKERAIEHGLHPIASSLDTGQIENAKQARAAFEYAVYSDAIKKAIKQDGRLAEYGQTTIANLRERFARLDKEMFGLNAKDIAARLARQEIPPGKHARLVSEYTEKRLIDNEVHKKTRHIPIRQLVRRAPGALQAAKPCFLMSPLSVSQYLAPGQIEFDLVVMDEASQIRPEDALGAIARGAKTIVVGDPKQLPPTSFFEMSSDDEDTEDSPLDDTESILDVCLKQIPYRRLRWHYRSQHESLIEFSNDQFYDRDLIFFPSPKGAAANLGVFFHFVEQPNYHKGINRGEAHLVVSKIIEHFRKTPEQSLGVAAFNRRQAEEIELLLERVRHENPEIDETISKSHPSEPLFVKNLENVQGDERDTIFISTTYGPEQPGEKVFQRFGPINSPTGWRRLNVIATRAKRRVEVFSSMRASDILISPTSSRGVVALKNYLAFAETKHIPTSSQATGGEPESPFEESVGKVLQDLGYKYEPQVGVVGFFIDIGVRNPVSEGEYLLGIECDGARYHSSKSVRDRDRLRQKILEDKGWTIHRIWSTNWYQAREAEIDKLKRVLEGQVEQARESRTATIEEVDSNLIETEVAEIFQEVQQEEIALEEASLETALDRFWETHVKPRFPVREGGILCPSIIPHLVSAKPDSKERWHNAVPEHIRSGIPSVQAVFLEDILELISEYR